MIYLFSSTSCFFATFPPVFGPVTDLRPEANELKRKSALEAAAAQKRISQMQARGKEVGRGVVGGVFFKEVFGVCFGGNFLGLLFGFSFFFKKIFFSSGFVRFLWVFVGFLGVFLVIF